MSDVSDRSHGKTASSDRAVSSDRSDTQAPPGVDAGDEKAFGSSDTKQPSKDFWDKSAAISGVVSSVLIASFGLYFNHTAGKNQQKLDALLGQQQHEIAINQNRLRELEVVESLLPHLASPETTEDRRKLALLAMRHLGNETLATEFAEVLGGEGAKAALTHIATTAASDEERQMAKSALTRLRLGAIENPTAEQIINKLNTLQGGLDDFEILERSGQIYMQTIGGPDDFRLEYRDGSGDEHFWCATTKQVVIDAFLSYATPPTQHLVMMRG